MAIVHFDVVANCTQANSAVSGLKSNISDLAGTTANTSVSVSGVSSTVSDLGRVSAAQSAISSTTTLGVSTVGVAEASSSLNSLRGDVQGLSKDLSGVSALNFGGVTGGGAIKSMISDLGAIPDVLSGASGSLGELQIGAGAAGRSLSAVDSQLQSVSTSADGAMSPLRQAAMSMSGGGAGSAIAESASAGSVAVRGLEQDMSGAGRAASQMSEQQIAAARGMANFRSMQGMFGVADGLTGGAGIPGTLDGPPGPPHGGGGGGGGGGFGDFFGGGGGGEGGLGGLGDAGGAAMPAVMLGAIGGVASLAAGAGGLMAVNEAISHTPALAFAANGAMQEFSRGITLASASAVSVGVPALHALGAELGGLGTEVGHIGAEQMGTGLTAVTSLAHGATTALAAMEPAIGPGITAIAGLGNALMQGISSPAAVAGIAQVGQMLSNPQIDQGIANLTGGLLTVSTIAGQVVGTVAGAVGNVVGVGGDEATPSVLGALGGAFLGGKIGGLPGALVGGVLGATGIAGSQFEQSQGQSPVPGITGEIGGSILGGLLGGPGGALVGGAAGEGLMDAAGALPGRFGPTTQDTLGGLLGGAAAGAAAGSLFGGVGAIPGAIIGGALGAGGGAAYAAYGDQQLTDGGGSFPTGQSSKYGWVDNGSGLVPASSPGGAGGYSLGQTTKAEQDTYAAAFSPQSSPNLPGPGSSAPLPNQTMVNALNQSMASYSQNAGQATQQTQQMGQSAQTAGQAAQNLGNNSLTSVGALNQVGSVANDQLGAASSMLQSGGADLGQVVTGSMASGINAGAGAACTASSQMGQSALDCAKNTLQSASPARAFVPLGESVPQGFALGVTSAAPLGSAAVAGAMTSAITSGAAALGTASPAKTGQTLGQSLMAQAAQGLGQSAQTGQLQSLAEQHAQGQLAAINAGHQNVFGNDAFGAAGFGPDRQQPGYAAGFGPNAADRNLNGPNAMQGSDGKQQGGQQGKPLDLTSPQGRQQRDQQLRDQQTSAFTRLGYGASGVNAAVGTLQTQRTHGDQTYDRLSNAWGGQDPHQAAMNLAKAGASAPGGPSAAGVEHGSSFGQGVASGANGQQGAVGQAGTNTGNALQNNTKKSIGMSSPSTAGIDIGSNFVSSIGLGASAVQGSVTASIGSGVAAMGSELASVASNVGLQAGTFFAENVATGALNTFQASAFASQAVTGIGSALAQTALGAANMLGVAGPGGETYKTPAVTLSSSTTTPTVTIGAVTAQFGSTIVDSISTQVTDAVMSGLNEAMTLQGS